MSILAWFVRRLGRPSQDGAMTTVVSPDGTRIAYTRRGRGPALVLVDGALCHRTFGPSEELARGLADRFTVYTYDRRGRGDSGDTPPYSVERELEDLEAIVNEAGGSAALYGISSGGALILEAAPRLPATKGIVLFEPPFVVNDIRPRPADMWPGIDAAIAAGDKSKAVKSFLRGVGAPSLVVAIMRLLPVWRRLAASAPTLPYDGALMKDYQRGDPLPRNRWSTVAAPTLVLVGSKSPGWMQNAMKSLAAILPNATHHVLQGQSHIVRAPVHVPVVTEFLTAGEEARSTEPSHAG
jgi:pimeloyl-ACP methyl ester carboxylesterase